MWSVGLKREISRSTASEGGSFFISFVKDGARREENVSGIFPFSADSGRNINCEEASRTHLLLIGDNEAFSLLSSLFLSLLFFFSFLPTLF
jgi:hypothetical protein